MEGCVEVDGCVEAEGCVEVEGCCGSDDWIVGRVKECGIDGVGKGLGRRGIAGCNGCGAMFGG